MLQIESFGGGGWSPRAKQLWYFFNVIPHSALRFRHARSVDLSCISLNYLPRTMFVSKHAEFDPQPPTSVCIERNSDKEKRSTREATEAWRIHAGHWYSLNRALSLLLNAKPACWKNIDGDTKETYVRDIMIQYLRLVHDIEKSLFYLSYSMQHHVIIWCKWRCRREKSFKTEQKFVLNEIKKLYLKCYLL
jgi:hypothetical protein